jgi:hypothetical protein
VARARAQEAVARQDHRDRLVGDGLHHRDRDALGFFDGRAPLVAEPLGVLAHFLRGELPAFGRRAQQPLQRACSFFSSSSSRSMRIPSRRASLPQADVEDVVGLALGELELRHELGLGLVALADELDHRLDVEEDEEPSLEDVDAVGDLVEAEPQPAARGRRAGT